MSDTDDMPISEQYRIVAKKHVEAAAVAMLLEETKSSVLQTWAQDLVQQEGLTGAEGERRVKASKKWKEHIESIVEARKKELLLRAQIEYIKMRFAEQQSDNANKRAEMRL